jgi:nitroreductase
LEFKNLCEVRRTERSFDADIDISDSDIRGILRLASYSPSAFNLQHWRFVVTREESVKSDLFEYCYFQKQIIECSAVITVCGNLSAHLDAQSIYEDQPSEVKNKFIPMINSIYSTDRGLQRDEVMRSGGLVSMSIMYAAKNEGWSTGPMIGFDPKKVSLRLNLKENIIPVMMLTIGKPKIVKPARPHRYLLEELLHYETYGNTGPS